jgi:AcrR family transcriptional regulator
MPTKTPADLPVSPSSRLGPSVPSSRRSPTQRRSRERVERLLAVATKLIAENGSDALRMSDVAARAGVSIGSLYQYFPDKAAIIRTLAERFNAQGRACVEPELAKVQTEADLQTALAFSLDGYYQMFLDNPVIQDIWSGTQADKTLHDIALADVRDHGQMLLDVLTRLRPNADPASLATKSLLLMHLTDATVRLAVSLPRPEGDALIAAFKPILLREAQTI